VDESYVPEPAILAGVFIQYEHILGGKIKGKKPDYDMKDPRTWPEVIFPADTLYSAIPTLPTGVAYTKVVIGIIGANPRTEIASRRADTISVRVTNDVVSINWRFCKYPFNFTRDGKPRERVGMSKDDLECWMSFTHRKKWTVALAAEPTSEEPTASSPPKTAYERVMASLAEQKAASLAYADLEQQLANLKAQYQQEKDRVDALEQKSAQQTADDAKVLASLRSKLKNSNDSVETLGEVVASWKAQALTAGKQVEELDEDLEMAKNEVVDIKKAAEKDMEDVFAEIEAVQAA
jgi:hypothetical protein